MKESRPILIVEDSDDDYYTTRRVLSALGSFHLDRCSKGTEVLDFLQTSQSPHEERTGPSLLILDLNLPGKKDGRVVLTELKSDLRSRTIPVVVMTTSSSPRDVSECYQRGASGYVVKPLDLDEFAACLKSLVVYWFETVLLPDKETSV
ncbi:MAG: response regulator [Acidobacteriales bacterium]|nr:response regulator [Terriglobales bacterium]